MSPQQRIEEYSALTSVLSSFNDYGKWAINDLILPKRSKFATLLPEQQKMLPWFENHLDKVSECIELNSIFFQQLGQQVAGDWNAPLDPKYWYVCKPSDTQKTRSLLTQISREWSTECREERHISFGRIIESLEELYQDLTIEQKSQLRILVPGAGLGRLILEIILKGYSCQGNEVSFHMLLASNFFLNKIPFQTNNNQTKLIKLYPFIHKFSLSPSRSKQVRSITVPDINPINELIILHQENPQLNVENLMSITTGSFVDIYGPNTKIQQSNFYSISNDSIRIREENKSRFDSVVTCFFLDTAINIIEYLYSIHNTLKPGGHWINFGPLLWHFEDDGDSTNVIVEDEEVHVPMEGLELSLEDLIDLIKEIGFKFVKRESGIKSTYGANPQSLGKWVYDCEFWVAQKL
ncbi:S-adenosylmethionine-dependent methyltransferase [Saccharomycopsis crataegensis]|uniref:carnosine N-methyltransferase n=1 Tax=Saccharomycopsis crataegensis TaxID=43959 RepID=A0AAV5QI63_9ASCO|nr:S-adenosylmethionine-dependent methyltransferase [Saccharomycopsis crataegensis]